MINKIKDFLKRLTLFSKKRVNDDVNDEIDESFDDDKTSPSLNLALLEETEVNQITQEEESTLPLEDWKKPTPFEKIKIFFHHSIRNLKSKSQPFLEKSGSSSRSSIDYDKLLKSLLASESREKIHQISLVIFLAVFTYSLGKTVAIFTKGTPVFEGTRVTDLSVTESEFNISSLNQVKNSNPFKTNVVGDKPKVVDSICEVAKQKSNLPVKLINSIVLQDEVKSIASVQIRSDRALKEFRVGDSIEQMAKIFKIHRLGLLVKNLETGECESIDNDALASKTRSPINVLSPGASAEFKANQKKMQGIENQGNKFLISKKLLTEKMKDIGTIITQAEAIKIQNPDGTLAFKITNIEAGSIYSFIGIEDSDIITSINGRPITDVNDIMQMFGKIESVSQLQLGIRRAGEEVQLDYNMQ